MLENVDNCYLCLSPFLEMLVRIMLVHLAGKTKEVTFMLTDIKV